MLIWHGKKVQANISKGMGTRVKLAAQLLRDKVVRNISRPVFKYTNSAGHIAVDPDSRSKPGEFPKADTTRLMKDIFWQMRGENDAVVGTTLDYGAYHELVSGRSFLVRTLREEQPMIKKIMLNGPKLPGQK